MIQYLVKWSADTHQGSVLRKEYTSLINSCSILSRMLEVAACLCDWGEHGNDVHTDRLHKENCLPMAKTKSNE